jgi:hypothetical protein
MKNRANVSANLWDFPGFCDHRIAQNEHEFHAQRCRPRYPHKHLDVVYRFQTPFDPFIQIPLAQFN